MRKKISIFCIVLMCIVLFSHNIKADEPIIYDSFTDGFKFIINNDGKNTCTIVGYESDVYTNIIPDEINGYTVTRIGDEAFKDKNQITGKLSLPDTIISIGQEAFRNCTHLTRVNLPDSVKTIGDRAFYNCDSLEKIDLGAVESIGNSAFYRCVSFQNTNIVMPNTLKSLGERVFAFCNIEAIKFTTRNAPRVSENTFLFFDGDVIIPKDRAGYIGTAWSGAIVDGVELTGDLDKDGRVNANDAAVALDLYKYGNVSDENIDIGDINRDGVINANDAALILDIYKYGK